MLTIQIARGSPKIVTDAQIEFRTIKEDAIAVRLTVDAIIRKKIRVVFRTLIKNMVWISNGHRKAEIKECS